MKNKNCNGKNSSAAKPARLRLQRCYCAVLLTLGPALGSTALAQSFVNYDGSRTSDGRAAVASWADNAEFKADWGLGAMNAQHAYAAGYSGQGVKLGAVDSGLLLSHKEFADRNVKALAVTGTYANDGARFSDGRKPWRAGEAFSNTGALIPANDKHGSHVSGSIAAAKNGSGMMGVAFASDYHITNTNGDDGMIYGVNMDYNYFKAAYGNLANAGVRAINSSWGSPDPRDDFGSIAGVAASYQRLQGGGKKSWLDAVADVTTGTNALMVWAAGNTGKTNVNSRSALPYFRPELEKNWIAVAALSKDLSMPSFSNQCGLARYWCVAAPGTGITSLDITSDTALVDAAGTSMAAPHVTGALGLLMERYPDLDNQAIRTILLTTSRHLGSGPANYPNATFGWGIPDLNQAMRGPAQLLGVFNANIRAGKSDVWHNDISEAALVQRKSEERAQLQAWLAVAPGSLQAAVDAAKAAATAKVTAQLAAGYDAALLLAQARAQRNADYEANKSTENYQAYSSANSLVRANPLAAAMVRMAGTGALPSRADLLAYLVANDAATVAALQALGNQEGQTAYLDEVRRKTDADYVGTLVKTGAGMLTLAGNNSYSGGTLLQQGTLAVASSTALGSGPLTMSDGTTLRAASGGLALANPIRLNGSGKIDSSDQLFTLSGGIADGSTAGSLIKQGSGTLRVTAPLAHTGNTTIADGILSVPSYQQAASQTLFFGVTSAAQYGKLVVDGQASFAADAKLGVDVAATPTLAQGERLSAVIKAGRLNAARFVVSDNSLLFDFQAAINGNSVDLNVVPGTSIARVVQQAGAAAAVVAPVVPVLDRQLARAPSGDMVKVVSALGRLPDAASVIRAASQTLPRNADAQAIRASVASVNRIVTSRIDTAASRSGSRGLSYGDGVADRQVWLMPFESRTNQGDHGGDAGFSASTNGMATGIEADLADTRVGLSYAYGNTRVDGNTALYGSASRSKIESNLVALYGSMPLGAMSLGLQGNLGWNSSRLTRELQFGDLRRIASSDYGTLDMHAGAKLSQLLPLTDRLSLMPALQLDYLQLHSRGYTEDGAGALNLTVADKRTQAFLAGVGARVNYALSPAALLSWHAGASYDLINDRNDMVASYAGSPAQSFTVPGTAQSPWLFKTGLSYRYTLLQSADLSLRYDVEGRRGFINQSAALKGSWNF